MLTSAMYGQHVKQNKPKQHRHNAIKWVFQEGLGSIFVFIDVLQFGQTVVILSLAEIIFGCIYKLFNNLWIEIFATQRSD